MAKREPEDKPEDGKRDGLRAREFDQVRKRASFAAKGKKTTRGRKGGKKKGGKKA